MCVHAHFDDYEFVVSGIFEMWKRKLGADFRGRLVVCTDGAAGHQFRTREETARMRLAEQRQSAQVGGYEFEPLLLPDGSALPECHPTMPRPFLAALWKAIRDFEPDYLICPPLASDPLVGIHTDHIAVAEAVRRVAYLINVPHAFTPYYPADETKSRACKVPIVLNAFDSYQGNRQVDIAIDIEEAFPKIAEMMWCHQTQVCEWLPWVDGKNIPPSASFDDWSKTLRKVLQTYSSACGVPRGRLAAGLTATSWGRVPTYEELFRELPCVLPEFSNLNALRQRLAIWNKSSS